MNHVSKNHVRDVRRAIDAWAVAQGLPSSPEHQGLAESICEAIGHRFRPPVARKGLLLDVDGDGDYCNARVVDWDGAEETLYPVDPETEEPVEEAVAHYAMPLPVPESFPDL